MFSSGTYYKRKVTAKEIDYEVGAPLGEQGAIQVELRHLLPKEMLCLKTELAEECEECFLQ